MNKPVFQTNVTDDEVARAFAGTNFGTANHRKLLVQGVLKRVAGYHSGHTLKTIMQHLGLTTPANGVSKKGREFLFAAFYDGENSG